MGKINYFQQVARQIGTAVPVLAPPRYLARRIETGQFETFPQAGASLPSPQVDQPAQQQMSTSHAPGVKGMDDFPLGRRSPGDAQLSPAAATGSATGIGRPIERVGLGPNGELTPRKTSKHEEASLPLGESSRKGTLERAPFLSLAAGNSPVSELTRDSFLKKGMETGAIADPGFATQIAMDKSLESPTDSIGLGYAHRNDGVAKKQPDTAIDKGASKSNDAVRIGVLEITVVSPQQPARQAGTGSSANKLSLSRGITRAYGLRQG